MNMASSVILHNLCSISLHSPKSKCYKNENLPLTLTHSQFLSSKSFLNLNKPSLLSNNNLRVQKSRSPPIVFAAQSNFLKGKLLSLFSFSFWVVYYNFIFAVTSYHACVWHGWALILSGFVEFWLFMNWFHLLVTEKV